MIINPKIMNRENASHTLLNKVYQPAHAVIQTQIKNRAINEIPVKKTVLCNRFVQNLVWNSSVPTNQDNIKHNTPTPIPDSSSIR